MPIDPLSGLKSMIAAAGLFGLGLYQFSQGNYAVAFQSIMAALAVFGVKAAISRMHNDVIATKP